MLGPANTGEIDAIEEHLQLGGVQSDRRLELLERRRLEFALFKGFVDDEEAARVPGQDFELRAPFVEKNEEVPAVNVDARGFDESRERVESLSHVGGFGGEKNTYT